MNVSKRRVNGSRLIFLRGSGTTTQGRFPLKPRAVVMAVDVAIYGDCVGAHAPDIKAVNAGRHGFAGPAQGIGGNDDVETRAGRLQRPRHP